ncbi:type I-F CRISPR-associated helicase Cas3 [Photobacterium phosphoreum]|uniref:type I-F CRISPR-associated helicase Cas3f n=1 Tax=Photobacterium phosphoreum TaxID=659 RepID=UPI000D161149|nr:type I-F CRISPR-associated helicase Cas3f [Photobacterium phosphoreum]PSW33518.1 type I-F CRISPR-associated helicase Cas3 [Photobacterium phosphoreum]
MNILIISQCNKKALDETRKVLDQFAERKGDRTWQTPITLEGLKTLRQLLKQTARRNTAVACHWIRSANNTELLWIVGNKRRFNELGTVPTNTTERNILRSEDENGWQSNYAVALMASLAGLFHDVGKANCLFQQKLTGKGSIAEPLRHEWLSLLVFQAFAKNKTDDQWLTELADLSPEKISKIVNDVQYTPALSPFIGLTELAKTIGWLIVSHHRLPTYQLSGFNPAIAESSSWLEQKLCPEWNAKNHKNPELIAKIADNFIFPYGLPLQSQTWQNKAQQLAKRALAHPNLRHFGQCDNAFPLHMARLSLMLADHCYSSSQPVIAWQDPLYKAYANTDRKTGKLKQKLDEHNIGVAQLAYRLSLGLPKLRLSLPAITRHSLFKKRTTINKFRWQDKAYDLACSVRDISEVHGFFGVNMASTGCGKTFANARIMYGLANQQQGCRFSIALGLRTLTLQTGDALKDRLKLDSDDLAVLVGSQAVKDLHESKLTTQQEAKAQQTGSESETLFSEHMYVSYDGSLDDGHLSQWLKQKPTIHKLVSAPITVSTIDYLMPATEGTRGGQQIAPMLRLFTGDLILDEPDDFGLEDLPALCRLVHWAGMLGSRVLLSSATLAPSLITALFKAYSHGRQQYNHSHGITETTVQCGWFDEFNVQAACINDADFKQQHTQFITQRAKTLSRKSLPLRQAELMHLDAEKLTQTDAVNYLSSHIQQAIYTLDERHRQVAPNDKTISIGLVRMANIEPLIAVGESLLSMPTSDNTCVHYCFYHSQHPMAVRAHIEQQLDAVLMRDPNNPQAILELPQIKTALEQQPQQHHIFVVVATAVAEVGRDHDYDWAVVEPSSMRSIIQLAGRIQRHRQCVPNSPNIMILSKNIKALLGADVAYCKPGFEQPKNNINKGHLQLNQHDLTQLLMADDYQVISAYPRFMEPTTLKPPFSLIELEHYALIYTLFKDSAKKVEYWWLQPYLHLFGEYQSQTRFRDSRPQTEYHFFIDNEDQTLSIKVRDEYSGEFVNKTELFHLAAIDNIASGNQAWFDCQYSVVYDGLSDIFDKDSEQISELFGGINLNDSNKTPRFYYHPWLGVFEGKYRN